ncbi:MAG: heme lyase NrfEFG subunit NrfE, partial [Gammaproteobacteria bacterium]
MNPELGQLALALSFCMTVLVAGFGLFGSPAGQQRRSAALDALVLGTFVLVLFAFGVLVAAFLGDDFTVRYVADNSNSALPWYYKVSAVWGAHEGSFLLWVLIMAGWTLAVALRSGDLPTLFRARVLGVMGLLNTGFVAFLIFTSNPFERLVPM